MIYFLNILIMISFCFSFDSNFGWFTSNDWKNSFKDYFSLSATVNVTEDHLFDFVSGLENASVNVISGPIPYGDMHLNFELIGSINNFHLDYDEFDYSSDFSYFQGGQFNINIHFRDPMSGSRSPALGFIAGYESIDTDIYLQTLSSETSLNFSYFTTEFSFGMYLIQDSKFSIYATYLFGDNELINEDYSSHYFLYDYDGWDVGIILPSYFLLQKSIAWQLSYESILFEEDFDEIPSITVQLKMIMDL